VPIYTVQVQKRHDPFRFILAAVMKDGSRLSGSDFKAALLGDTGGKHPEDVPGNFREDVERHIAYLITTAANVQLEEDHARSIGPWDFDRLGHEDRRELRGLGLLAAWVGWFDSRFENTRLKVITSGGRSELQHYITDPGGGLGKCVGPLRRRCELPNQFDWFCTRAPKSQGKGRMTIPFRIVNYAPIDDTLAFEKMTLDDARWMGRMIGQLSEAQIVQALVASGFDSAQVRIYTEKLVSRRDQMMHDLGLTPEINLFRPGGIDRHFAYDPALDGPVKIKTTSGQEVVARSANLVVQKGRIVSNGQPAPPQATPAHVARAR
jgi:hypothetical protein